MRERSSGLGLAVAFGTVFFAACSGGGSGGTGTAGAGAAGVSGSAGANGSAGASGSAGATGSAGANGSAGAGSSSAGATGSAGASSASAGATGSAGASSASAGATGSAGASSDAGLANAVPSDGCGKDPAQALTSYVKYMEMVTGVTAKQAPRNYYVWLPAGYDPQRAYPTVFVGPGCGSNGTQGIQIQVASTTNAIVIGLDPSMNVDPEGRQCFDSQSDPNPEIPYVEQTVAKVEAAFCVDKSRLFIEGFSSGSWLSYLMGCVDGGPGGLFKAEGNASGEDQGWTGTKDSFTCKGPTPWMAGHNNPDPNNAYPGGRDHMIKMNGCTMPPVTGPFTQPAMVKPPATPAGVTINCVQYQGCTVPTIFCTTTNLGHNSQEVTGISTYGMWAFWMSLP